MLVIRLQRTGRKGHAMFRIIVQDSRRSPTSGSVVAFLGSYDPHTKKAIISQEKASFYLEHGAQPSDRVISLLKAQSIKLPKWAVSSPAKKKDVRNTEKRRSTATQEAEKPAAESTEPEQPADSESKAEVEQPEASEPAATETTQEAEAPSSDSAEPTEEPAEAEVPAETEPEPVAEESTKDASEEQPEETTKKS